MPAIATPNQGMTAINKLILELRKLNPPYDYKEVSDIMNNNPTVTSQTLSSAREVGLLKSGGVRGLYDFTLLGREYSIELSYGRATEAKSVLKKTILENTKWADIIEFLRQQKDIPFDPVFIVRNVEKKLGKTWSIKMRERMRTTYVSILRSAGLIEIKGRRAFSTIGISQITRQDLIEVPRLEHETNHKVESDFATLETNDFSFKIRKDIKVLDFATNQFESWIEYIKNNLEES